MRYLVLSRNFGHQGALSAGLAFASGDAVIMMDADLQHPPGLIPILLARWQDGYDVVNTARLETEDSELAKTLSSRAFYWLFRALTGLAMEPGSADFRLMAREPINALNSLPERHRFIRGLVPWLGFRQTSVSFNAPARFAGRPKYTFLRSLRLAIDGITAFNLYPLRLVALLGLALDGIKLRLRSVGTLQATAWRAEYRRMDSARDQYSLSGRLSARVARDHQRIRGALLDQVTGRPLYILSTTCGFPWSPTTERSARAWRRISRCRHDRRLVPDQKRKGRRDDKISGGRGSVRAQPRETCGRPFRRRPFGCPETRAERWGGRGRRWRSRARGDLRSAVRAGSGDSRPTDVRAGSGDPRPTQVAMGAATLRVPGDPRRTQVGVLAGTGRPGALAAGAGAGCVLSEAARRAPLPPPHGDAALYAYQLTHAAEHGGRWWRVGDNLRLGNPYPTELAKHPGLYEGVDLMLLASLTRGALGATLTYHLAVLIALAVNGWVAAWIVLRLTRSVIWAGVATALITLNPSVAARILGHLHLFKFGWSLLAVWAFIRFLDQPDRRRGLVLGLAVALVLQSSFYLGFFIFLGLGLVYLTRACGGPAQGRQCLGDGGRCARVRGGERGVLFPRLDAVAAHRDRRTILSARLVRNLELRFRALAVRRPAHLMARLQLLPRRAPAPESAPHGRGLELPRVHDRAGRRHCGREPSARTQAIRKSRFMGARRALALRRLDHSQPGRWAIGALVFSGAQLSVLWAFGLACRCDGRGARAFDLPRAGARDRLAARAHFVDVRRARSGRLRRADGGAGVPGLAGRAPAPEWVDWLKIQPSNVRLAAFALPPEGRAPTLDWWGVQAATWLARHHHATLNGCNFALFEGDLRLLGGSYTRINPAGLRFVVSLGYETLAFHHDYIAANSWITSVPWLEPIVHDGAWQIFRARDDLPRLPARAFAEVLALGQDDAAPREAPPGSWITASWPVPADLVVTNVDWALLAWTDESGRSLTPQVPALFQHVFGPSIPAFVVRTPDRPGRCRLTVRDRERRVRASLAYRIVPNLAVSQREFPARRPGVTSHSVVLEPARWSSERASLELSLANASPRYVQTHVFREHLSGAAQSHPGLQLRWLKAGFGGLVLRVAPNGADSNEPADGRDIPLACDLEPGGRLNVTLALDRLPATWRGLPLRIEPSFTGIGHAEAPPRLAELKLAVAAGAARAEIARPETNRQPAKR